MEQNNDIVTAQAVPVIEKIMKDDIQPSNEITKSKER